MGPIYQVMGMYQVSVSRGNAQKQQETFVQTTGAQVHWGIHILNKQVFIRRNKSDSEAPQCRRLPWMDTRITLQAVKRDDSCAAFWLKPRKTQRREPQQQWNIDI